MAITIDGVVVSGSYGLVTQSRNRYGAYRRRRTKPVNPTSPRQVAARASFRNAVNAWTTGVGLTVDAAYWDAYALAVPWLNRAGETVRLTGQAMYIRSRAAADAAGLAPGYMSTAPTILNLGFLNVTAPDPLEHDGTLLTTTLGTIVANNTWAAVGGKLLVEISLPANPGRKFPGSKWQSAAVITGANTATHALSITLTDLSFPPAPDQIVWLRVRGIGNSSDRRVSTQQILGPFSITSV